MSEQVKRYGKEADKLFRDFDSIKNKLEENNETDNKK